MTDLPITEDTEFHLDSIIRLSLLSSQSHQKLLFDEKDWLMRLDFWETFQEYPR